MPVEPAPWPRDAQFRCTAEKLGKEFAWAGLTAGQMRPSRRRFPIRAACIRFSTACPCRATWMQISTVLQLRIAVTDLETHGSNDKAAGYLIACSLIFLRDRSRRFHCSSFAGKRKRLVDYCMRRFNGKLYSIIDRRIMFHLNLRELNYICIC